MRAILLSALVLLAMTALPAAEAGQPCTTPPKRPVDALLWAAACQAENLPEPGEFVPEPARGEIDLRWMTNCPGPWGHEERTTVGPVVIVTYACDDGGA